MLSISPFLVIDDNTNFGVIKSFKSTLYTRHKVNLELNFGRTYSFFLNILKHFTRPSRVPRSATSRTSALLMHTTSEFEVRTHPLGLGFMRFGDFLIRSESLSFPFF